jgi:hypothetical protein
MPRVFLSYSRHDAQVVDAIAERLRQEGITVWFYKNVITIDAQDWLSEIEKAIRQADFVLSFISQASLTSAWVEAEYRAAFKHQQHVSGSRLIPVLLEKTELPDFLVDTQFVDFTESHSQGMRTLLRMLRLPSGPKLIETIDVSEFARLVAIEVAKLLGLESGAIPKRLLTKDQIGAGYMQRRVTFDLLGKNRLDWATDNFECWFGVSMVDTRFVGQPREHSETDFHRMKVGITWELRVNWKLDSDSAEMDVVKVLFERAREHVIEGLQKGLPLENEILLTTQNSPDYCPYDLSLIANPPTSASFVVNLSSQSLPQQVREVELFVEDIDSFCEAGNVQPQEVKALLPLDLSEDEIQAFFEEIVGENFHQEDWGGELNDLVTSQLKVSGKRIRAAFLLKGSGTRGKLTIAKCGKNGDQIVRLVEAPVDLYVIQHIGEIDQRVIYDLRGKVQLKVSEGQKCQMCVLDGTDTARILRAYGKI